MSNLIYECTKEFTFDMAHRLVGHPGKCINLHGHTYKLQVTVAHNNASLNKEGMVVDFSEINRIWKEHIESEYDHVTLLQDCIENKELIKILYESRCKVTLIDDAPTAENMARIFYDSFNTILRVLGLNLVVTKIRLYETPTSYAEVF